jgi:hypothetical protein
MEKSWMIDELAHAGAEHLDAAFVAMTSSRLKPRMSSADGSTVPRKIQQLDTRATTMPYTFVASTVRSGGSLSRCSPLRVLRS